MSARDEYPEVGRAMRLAIDRAQKARITGRQWRVLAALLRITASYSRLADDVYVQEIAERSGGLDYRHARTVLKQLHELGIIEWTSGRGRGKRSRVGLPRNRAADGAVFAVETAPGPDEKPRRPGDENRAVRGAPPEKIFREELSEEDAAGDESFNTLLRGLGYISPAQRNELAVAWREDPAGFAVLAKEAETGAKPIALLVSMVRSGAHREAATGRPSPDELWRARLDARFGDAYRYIDPRFFPQSRGGTE